MIYRKTTQGHVVAIDAEEIVAIESREHKHGEMFVKGLSTKYIFVLTLRSGVQFDVVREDFETLDRFLVAEGL